MGLISRVSSRTYRNTNKYVRRNIKEARRQRILNKAKEREKDILGDRIAPGVDDGNFKPTQPTESKTDSDKTTEEPQQELDLKQDDGKLDLAAMMILTVILNVCSTANESILINYQNELCMGGLRIQPDGMTKTYAMGITAFLLLKAMFYGIKLPNSGFIPLVRNALAVMNFNTAILDLILKCSMLLLNYLRCILYTIVIHTLLHSATAFVGHFN